MCFKPINIFQTYLQAMHKRHPAVPSFFSFLSMTPAIFWGRICFGSITLPIRFQGQLIFHHYESDSRSQPFLVANSYHSINCQLLYSLSLSAPNFVLLLVVNVVYTLLYILKCCGDMTTEFNVLSI